MDKELFQNIVETSCRIGHFVNGSKNDGVFATISEITDTGFYAESPHTDFEKALFDFTEMTVETETDKVIILTDKDNRFVFYKVCTEIVLNEVVNDIFPAPEGDFVKIEIPMIDVHSSVFRAAVVDSLDNNLDFYDDDYMVSTVENACHPANLDGFKAVVETNEILRNLRNHVLTYYALFFGTDMTTGKAVDGGYVDGKAFIYIERDWVQRVLDAHGCNSVEEVIDEAWDNEVLHMPNTTWKERVEFIFEEWVEFWNDREDYLDENQFGDNIHVSKTKTS